MGKLITTTTPVSTTVEKLQPPPHMPSLDLRYERELPDEITYIAPMWGDLPRPLKYELKPTETIAATEAQLPQTLLGHRKPNWYQQPEGSVPLPVVGLNIQRLNFVPHYPTLVTEYTEKFRREEWEQDTLRVFYARHKIYHESELRLPAELYRIYPHYQRQAAFVDYVASTGKFMYMLGGNVFWVNDAAELALLGEHNVDRELWETQVLSMSPDHPYYAEWVAQRDLLSADYHAKGIITTPSYQLGHLPIEVYDGSLNLLVVCRDRRAAELETGVENRTISSAALAHKPSHGYYFRYYYDNSYHYDESYPICQYCGDVLVNRFRTLTQATEMMKLMKGYIKSTYFNSGKLDIYGCHWEDSREIAKLNARKS